jgi:hypothetical protein
MGYINLTAAIFCGALSVLEFRRMEDTRQFQLFLDVFLCGANLYWANLYFGWF